MLDWVSISQVSLLEVMSLWQIVANAVENLQHWIAFNGNAREKTLLENSHVRTCIHVTASDTTCIPHTAQSIANL